MKIGWIVLGGTGLFLGGRYLWQMNRLNTNLEMVITAKLHSVTLAGIRIRVDVTLKNPTKGKIKIMFPFVKIMHEGKTVGSSQSVNKEIEIPSFGQAVIEAIMIDITFSQLLINAWGMYQLVKEGKPVVVQVKVMSAIKMLWGDQPYEQTQDITLKGGTTTP